MSGYLSLSPYFDFDSYMGNDNERFDPLAPS